MTQTRDSHGRFKTDHRARNIAIGTASVLGLGAAAIGAAARFGLLDRFFPAHDDAAGRRDFERTEAAPAMSGDDGGLRRAPDLDAGFTEIRRTETFAAIQ